MWVFTMLPDLIRGLTNGLHYLWRDQARRDPSHGEKYLEESSMITTETPLDPCG